MEYNNTIQKELQEIQNIKNKIVNENRRNEFERKRIFDENLNEYKKFFRTLIDPFIISKNMQLYNKNIDIPIMCFDNNRGWLGKLLFGNPSGPLVSKREVLSEKALSISENFYNYHLSNEKDCEIAKGLYQEIFPNKIEFKCREHFTCLKGNWLTTLTASVKE